MRLAHLLTVRVIERCGELGDGLPLCFFPIRIIQRVEFVQKHARIAGEWIGNYIGFNQMACQEIMVEFLKDVPISPLRIAILYTLKQLSKRVRYVKIVAYMICVSGQFP